MRGSDRGRVDNSFVSPRVPLFYLINIFTSHHMATDDALTQGSARGNATHDATNFAVCATLRERQSSEKIDSHEKKTAKITTQLHTGCWKNLILG